MEYIIAFVIAIGINLILFVPAFLFKTDTLTDFSYALSFILASSILFIFSEKTLPHIIVLSMIVIWALRLGIYLFIRIQNMKKDSRFDGMREDFFRFLKFWFFQGLSVAVILLPSIALFETTTTKISILSYIGIIIWATGLLIEAIADYQKYTFITQKKNPGKWIASGLWKYSRHPNYVGEIMLWIGIYIFTLPYLSLIPILVGLLSPLYIAFIIIKISGVPMLEKSADERWGDDPDYQQYKKDTPVLL